MLLDEDCGLIYVMELRLSAGMKTHAEAVLEKIPAQEYRA